jgi:hypothetical protein
MKSSICFAVTMTTVLLGALPATAATFKDVKIDFNEFAFPGSNPMAMAGAYQYNVLNDVTGSKLAAENHDLPDFSIGFSASEPIAKTAANLEWQSAGKGRWTSTRSFKASAAKNNPGTLISTTALLRFNSHLTVTNLSAAFTSLNSAGNLWEYSLLGVLQPDGTPFSAAPIVPAYNEANSAIGLSTIGWYVAASKGTVTGVGTAETNSGLNGALTTTQSGNPKDDITLTYALVGLAPDTPIGGLIWTTYLADTRGINNGTSSFTASWVDLTIDGMTLNPVAGGPVNGASNAVPTPALLPGLIGMGLGLWRRREKTRFG